MKMNSGLMAGASRFAHFAGLTRSARSGRAEDDTTDDRDAEEDGDGKDASEDDDTDDQPKGKRSRKAEDDDDGKDASEDDDDDDDQPSGSRGRKAEDDDKDASDDDDDEMKGKGAVAQARRREQARISHILGHRAAANNPLLALSLACETRMTRREAVAVLKQQPQQASEDRGNRHARPERQSRNVNLGNDTTMSGKQATDASWGAAFKKVGVRTTR